VYALSALVCQVRDADEDDGMTTSTSERQVMFSWWCQYGNIPHACTHPRKHILTHTHKHSCTHVCMHAHMRVHTHVLTHTQALMHACVHACTHACAHTHTHIHTHLTRTGSSSHSGSCSGPSCCGRIQGCRGKCRSRGAFSIAHSGTRTVRDV